MRRSWNKTFDCCEISDLPNINIDLIAGLPGQTEASWRESLEAALRLEVPHISVYMLEVDEDSRLGAEILLGGKRYGASDVPSDDQSRISTRPPSSVLEAHGIHRYEISNFARTGAESIHNLKYWKREPYIGFGADAHSFDGSSRWQNVESAQDYVARSERGESVRSAETSPDPGRRKVLRRAPSFRRRPRRRRRLAALRPRLRTFPLHRMSGALERQPSPDAPRRNGIERNFPGVLDRMIDLRSDTVTKPTPAMRQAMFEAEVGDDVYGEDPTANKLEQRAAEIAGKEAALFVPTGTMGNTIAIKLLTEHGQEVICDSRAHLLDWELSMLAWFSGCLIRSRRNEGRHSDLGSDPARVLKPAALIPRPLAQSKSRTPTTWPAAASIRRK